MLHIPHHRQYLLSDATIPQLFEFENHFLQKTAAKSTVFYGFKSRLIPI